MNSDTYRLVVALARRTLRQNAVSLLLVPLGFVIICVMFVVVAKYFPQILTGPTDRSLEAMAKTHAGVAGDVSTARAWSALFLQAPYLATFLGSTYVVSLLSSSLQAEAHKGGFEMLLAEPFLPRQIVTAFFWNSLIISGTIWAAVAVLLVAAAAGLVWYLGLNPPNGFAPAAVALMLPLAGILWAAQIILALHLLFPHLSSVRVGSSRAVVNYVATLPAVVAFVIITFRPELDPVWITTLFLGIGLLGAIVVSSALSYAFRPSVLLEST